MAPEAVITLPVIAAILISACTTVCFAFSAVFAGKTTRILGGSWANFIRICLATVLLAIWAHGFGAGLSGGALGYFFLSGCIGFGIGDVALYQALPRLGPRLSILLVHCLAAPFAAATERAWLGTVLSWGQIGAGLVILLGVAVALAPGQKMLSEGRQLAAGIAFGVLAALAQGGGAVVSRRAYQVVAAAGENVDGGSAAYQRILGGVVIGVLPLLWMRFRESADPGGGRSGPNRENLSKAFPWIVANCIAGPSLGVALYQRALKTAPSGVVLPVVATTPLVVIPVAMWLDGDKPTRWAILGGALAVVGAVLLAFQRG